MKVYVLTSVGGAYEDAWERQHGVFKTLEGAKKEARSIREPSHLYGGSMDRRRWHINTGNINRMWSIDVKTTNRDACSAFWIEEFELKD